MGDNFCHIVRFMINAFEKKSEFSLQVIEPSNHSPIFETVLRDAITKDDDMITVLTPESMRDKIECIFIK